MKKENIIKNITLEQYKKKYRNRYHRILEYKVDEVVNFDKQNQTRNKELLKGRKWCLIGDTYYEIPRAPRLTWFRNLSVGIQIATCSVFCVGITSAVVFPTLANTVWNKDAPTPTPETDDGWMKKSNWYDLTDKATKNDIGKTVKIKVNGLDHEVVLIDVDKDTDSNGNKIHTTWNFKNLICDEDGNSLAYQWRDCFNSTASDKTWCGKTLDYTNSSINYALNGTGTNGFKNISDDDPNYTQEEKYAYNDEKGNAGANNTDILVLRYGNTYWEERGTKYTKPIIDMIPNEITSKMKEVSKVNNNKLFVLSSREIDGGYSYYRYSGLKGRIRRIKSQINQELTEEEKEKGGRKAYQNISPKTGEGEQRLQLFNYNGVMGRAGNNEFSGIDGSNIYSGYYWCRDLGTSGPTGYQYINRVSYKGSIGAGCPIRDGYGVAPAFCI